MRKRRSIADYLGELVRRELGESKKPAKETGSEKPEVPRRRSAPHVRLADQELLTGAAAVATRIASVGAAMWLQSHYRSGYKGAIVAEAGIRELRDHLSKYLERVRDGEEVIVTDRGTAVARVVPIEQPRPYDRLVAEGIIEPSKAEERTRPKKRVEADGSVSDLVADQRR
ncbi:MAG: type II toxin-antitoxin system prevent-host-death family antitoxin [Actinomycetota bacterium]|nr:type II toxin-antitoxin system prevent-host-death family antitoxin [Actinomycetota bacterium]